MTADAQTIVDFGRALRAGTTTAEAAVERCLRTIAGRDQSINAFITVLADQAIAQARVADRELAAGHDRGPLHGVPISLKDILDLEGVCTSAASRVRADHRARRDGVVVARLRAAGAVFVGKTNLHEFALGTTNEDSAYGAVVHPLDPSRSPGGSSGGSAAAVLADMSLASIGTDTGGSIRIPAAACGLIGLKPALGEVSTQGVVPLSTTMDHVGPLCRSVDDAALLHDAMCGLPRAAATPEGVAASSLRVGVLRGYFTELLDPEVEGAFEALCSRLEGAGVSLSPASIPHAGDIAAVYVHIVLSEGATYHAPTLESRPDEYTTSVRLRLEMGRYILAEDYVRALRGRDILRQEVEDALQHCDVLLLPTLPVPATKLGASHVRVGGTEEAVRNITLRLTQLFNISGHAAISIPCGVTAGGLPIGAQLVGRTTATLLRAARALAPHFGPGRS